MHWLVPLLTLITNQYVYSLKWKEVKKNTNTIKRNADQKQDRGMQLSLLSITDKVHENCMTSEVFSTNWTLKRYKQSSDLKKSFNLFLQILKEINKYIFYLYDHFVSTNMKWFDLAPGFTFVTTREAAYLKEGAYFFTIFWETSECKTKLWCLFDW